MADNPIDPKAQATAEKELLGLLTKQADLQKSLAASSGKMADLLKDRLKTIQAEELQLKKNSELDKAAIERVVKRSEHLQKVAVQEERIANQKKKDDEAEAKRQKALSEATAERQKAAEASLNRMVGLSTKLSQEVIKVHDAYKTLGKATGLVEQFSGETTAAWQSTAKFGATLEDNSVAVKALQDDLPRLTSIVKSDRAALIEQAVAYEKAGLGAENFSSIAGTMMNTLGRSTKATIAFSQSIVKLGTETGIGATKLASVFKDMGKDLVQFGDDAESTFINLAKQSRSLGVDMKDLLSIAEGYDTFEEAATRVGKLNAQMGLNLNAVAMMNEQDPTKRIQMIRDQFLMTGKSFETMTRLEKKAAADLATGGDVSLAARLLGSEDDFKQATKGRETAQELADEFMTLGNKITALFQSFLAAAMPAIKVGIFAIGLFVDVLSGLVWFLDTKLGAGITVVLAFGASFVALTAAVGFAYGKIQMLFGALPALLGLVNKPMNVGIGLIKKTAAGIMSLPGLFKKGASGVASFGSTLKKAFTDIPGTLTSIASGAKSAGSKLYDFLTGAPAAAKETTDALGSAQTAVEGITDTADVKSPSIGSSIKEKLSNLAEGLKSLAGGKVAKGSFNLLKAAPGLLLAAPGLALIALVGKIDKGGKGIKGILSGLGKGLTQLATGAAGAGVLLLASAPLLLAAPGLALIALVGKIDKGGKGIKGILSGLAAGLTALGKGPVFMGALAIAAVGLALLPFALAMNMMAGVGIGTFIGAALGVGLIGLAAAGLGVIAPLVFIGALAIGALGLALIPFASAMSTISSVDPSNMSAVATGIGEIAWAAAKVALYSAGVLIGSAALGVLGVSLTSFTKALDQMKSVDVSTLPALALGIGEIAWAVAKLALYSGGIVIGAGALATLGSSLLDFGLGLGLIGSNMEGFVTFLNTINAIDASGIYSLATAMNALSMAGFALGLAFANPITLFGLWSLSTMLDNMFSADKVAGATALQGAFDGVQNLIKASVEIDPTSIENVEKLVDQVIRVTDEANTKEDVLDKIMRILGIDESGKKEGAASGSPTTIKLMLKERELGSIVADLIDQRYDLATATG